VPDTRRPGRLVRWLLRAPARLYDWHAGWLLDDRFLRLTHVGRRSGRRHQTVLEVIGTRPGGEAIVPVGRGRNADLFRNVQAHPAVEVAIGRRRFRPVHRVLAESEAGAVLAAYEQRNSLIAPVVRAVLSWLVGWRYDGSAATRRHLVRELPVVGFRPRHPGAGGDASPPDSLLPSGTG
jgi:deazaflavin-dependent oxidoreductase (nitroreductase family)